MKRMFIGLAVAGAGLSLAGCEWEFGTVAEEQDGSVTLELADAPVDELSAVNITITAVALKPADGEALTFDYDPPRQIDLLDLQNGNTERLLDDETVPAEAFEWVRLSLSQQSGDNFAVGNDGGTYSLIVPAGSLSGLQVNAGFSVEKGENLGLTLDFDVRKSVVDTNSVQADYLLKPTLRLVENDNVGSISGSVDESTVIAARCADAQSYSGLVYVYEGDGVEPDDLGSGTEPVTAVPVSDAENPGTYSYSATLLNEGDYTVSYSCALDNNEADESLSFLSPESVAVQAGRTARLNLE